MKKLLLLSLAFLFAKGLPKAKALTLALTFSLAFSLVSFAQNIAITDDNGYTADPSAMLDVKSTTKGMLVPRVTTNQRNTISNPANGLLVFDTDLQSFFFNDGAAWTNLSSGNPSDLWGQSGNKIFLNDTTYTLGIGTHNPAGKLQVKADAANAVTDAIFGVINNNGDTVFAVYPEGVRINVADDANKSASSKSGFAVGGFSLTKGATAEYLRVTPDSVRVYVEESSANKATGSKGGFAVGGFSLTKGTLTNEYLRVTDDSVRVYIDKDGGTKATGSKGGFAVGGFSLTKSTPDDYLVISGADSTEVINPAQARILWYPIKKAFLTGTVLIESVDSVGTNSMATGNESKAIGENSQAFGFHPRAFGANSTAIGNYAEAIGSNSYAFGNYAYAEDSASYAIGSGAKATGLRSFALGSTGIDSAGTATNPTIASGDYSYAFGMGSVADNIGAFAFGTQNTASGQYSLSLGYQSNSSEYSSISMGYKASSSGSFSTAIGREATASGMSSIAIGANTTASNNYATAIGSGTLADGYISTALGVSTTASGFFTTSMGYYSNASSWYSTAMGRYSVASGSSSVAMGDSAVASGGGAVAMCSRTTASASSAFASGLKTIASGSVSTAMGGFTIAKGMYSTAMGRGIEARGNYSFAIALNDQAGTVITSANTMAIMGGNVGIGTTSPDGLLHIESVGDALAIIHADNNNYGEEDNPRLELRQDGTAVIGGLGYVGSTGQIFSNSIGNAMYLINDYSSPLQLGTGNTAHMTILNSGSVGIGTTSPSTSFKLDVSGNINLNKGISSGGALYVNGSEALWFNGTYFSWGYGGSVNYFADKVGIGTSTPSYKLELPNNSTYYYGSARAYSWATYSDSRVKKNQEELDYGIEELMKLVPKKYDHYTSEFENGKLKLNKDYSTTIGLIAQEVYKIIPEAAEKPVDEATDLWSLDYEKLIPVMINSIKELNRELIIQTKENETLKAEIETIKSILKASASKK